MFGKWLPFIIKSVLLVDTITGLHGVGKKEKALGLTLGFLSLLGENITESTKDQINTGIDDTVLLLNNEGIFEKSGAETARLEAEELERQRAEEEAKQIAEAEALAAEEAKAKALAEAEAKAKTLETEAALLHSEPPKIGEI